MKDILLYFSLKYDGNFEKIYEALERKERIDPDEKDRLFATIKCNYTTMISKDYPESLKNH